VALALLCRAGAETNHDPFFAGKQASSPLKSSSHHLTGCPGKWLEAPSLEVFKKHVDMALEDVV